MGLQTEISSLAGLLILSGFFSSAEIALISLSKFKVRQMVLENRFGSRSVKRLKDEPQRMLSTILIGNNLVNVGASALLTSIMIAQFQNYAVGIATGVMTFLILVFGEIIPKSVAVQHNELVSRLVSPPVWYLSIVLTPLLAILNWFVARFMRLFGIKSQRKTITEEEIISVIKTAEEEGSIEKIERNLINRIFRFSEMNVGEVATPVRDMTAISSKATVKEALQLALRSKFSRIPVYEKHRDSIKGVVYFKDLVLLGQKKREMQIAAIMKKPFFVPNSKKISDLLRRFQKRKEHMALVVNEHGSLDGLVTLEDILEEIVGEIMDETDRLDPNVMKISDRTWLIKGRTEIEELNEKLHMGLKDAEDYDTFSGFILKQVGKIPKEKEEMSYGSFRMKIQKVDNNRISLVRVERV